MMTIRDTGRKLPEDEAGCGRCRRQGHQQHKSDRRHLCPRHPPPHKGTVSPRKTAPVTKKLF